jgi:uncharacterized membrane protein YfcA
MELVTVIIYLSIGIAAAIAGSLMGVGGGFMMVPIFVFMGYNEGYILAPVLSLFVIIFVASSASLKYSHEKLINYKLGLLYAPFSIMGAFVGAKLLLYINTLIFKIVFSILIVVIGIRLILRQRNAVSNEDENSDNERKSYYWVIVWGFITGLTASLVGIGGGLIAVPVIHIFFLETMHMAIATSLFIMIFTATFSTLWNYINLVNILDAEFFLVGLIIAAGAVLGAQIGSRIQTRLKGRDLQIIFGFFMIAIAIPLLWLGH